jgi:hypothetical protein
VLQCFLLERGGGEGGDLGNILLEFEIRYVGGDSEYMTIICFDTVTYE